MGISYYFTDGSRNLDFYSYGTALLAVGLLAALVLFVRRLGPAVTVLPWCVFYLATRSQDGYYLLMTPLWLAAAATVPASAFATAWQPRLPRLNGRKVRMALAAGLMVPAAACVTVAAASPPPLNLDISDVRMAAHTTRPGITDLVLQATNTTGAAITPHWATRIGQGASNWWRIKSGPTTLAPHSVARYVLQPAGAVYHLPIEADLRMYLIAVTGKPMTISSVKLPLTSTRSA
jgi:hypothetical protein